MHVIAKTRAKVVAVQVFVEIAYLKRIDNLRTCVGQIDQSLFEHFSYLGIGVFGVYERPQYTNTSAMERIRIKKVRVVRLELVFSGFRIGICGIISSDNVEDFGAVSHGTHHRSRYVPIKGQRNYAITAGQADCRSNAEQGKMR